MNKKDLQKLFTLEKLNGIDEKGLEGLLDEVIVLHGKDIEGHKTKVSQLEEDGKKVADQLAEANKQIEGMKALDPEGLKKAAADWETKSGEFEKQLKDSQKQAAEDLAAEQLSHAIELGLRDAKSKNTKSVRALLKVEDIKLDKEGNLVGLEEQLKKIREENEFLFEPAEPNPEEPGFFTENTPGVPVEGDAFTKAAMEGAGVAPPKENK